MDTGDIGGLLRHEGCKKSFGHLLISMKITIRKLRVFSEFIIKQFFHAHDSMVFFLSSLLLAAGFIESISHLPLFIQVVLAVIVVGIAFAILKKVVKFAIWLVILLLAVLVYIRFVQ
jgi:hypothetical protein